jgi:LPXTG-motif cell wall-anchored protein
MRRLLPYAIALLLLVLTMDAEAQCVMCKAVAEDSAEDGSLGRGLNSGILYLMGIPYAIMAFFAWFVFRKRKEATDVAG